MNVNKELNDRMVTAFPTHPMHTLDGNIYADVLHYAFKLNKLGKSSMQGDKNYGGVNYRAVSSIYGLLSSKRQFCWYQN